MIFAWTISRHGQLTLKLTQCRLTELCAGRKKEQNVKNLGSLFNNKISQSSQLEVQCIEYSFGVDIF